jgi:ornithine decarboxylase
MTPAAFGEAMARVRAAIVEAAVTVDIVDVGGGFPSTYPGWSRRRSKPISK